MHYVSVRVCNNLLNLIHSECCWSKNCFLMCN
jgi:hypothetical protein